MVKWSRAIAAGLCALLIAGGAAFLMREQMFPSIQFEVHGHRGSYGVRPPGNTLIAFEAAMAQGADVLEADLRRSGDGKLVLLHDEKIPVACVHPKGKAARTLTQLSLAKIRAFDCHPSVPGIQSPPTLVDLLALIEKTSVGLNLELKPEGNEIAQSVATTLLDYDKKCDGCLRERVTIESFHAEHLALLRELMAHQQLKFRLSFLSRGTSLFELKKMKPFVDIYSPHAGLAQLDAAMIAHIKNEGFLIIPWTVNETYEICELARLGVDGVITDFPGRASTVAHGIRKENARPTHCDSYREPISADAVSPK